MRKLIALAAVCSAAFVWADTPIPEGSAYYDVTLTFTDYPELDDWGAWPVEMNLLLGPNSSCRGERVSTVTNDNGSISLTVRMVWDIAAMLDYAKTDDYKGGQSHIYMRNYLTQYYNTGGDGGVWTSANKKFNLASVETVEGFMSAIAADFLDTDSHRTMSDPKEDNVVLRSEPKTMLQSMSIKLVGTPDKTLRQAGDPILCKLRIRFNRSLSNAGYDSVSRLRLVHGNVFDFTTDHVTLSSDGCEVVGLVKTDIGAIFAAVNDPDYRSVDANKGQTRIYLNGSTDSISGGSQIWLDQIESSSAFGVSKSIKNSILYRTYAKSPCRVVGLELSPRPKDGSLMFMKW